MSSSCIEEVSVPDDNWYRIANELLSRAGIAINGSAPADIRVKNPDFFKRVLQEGSLGLGESYMDGWWECDRLDMFLAKSYAQVPRTNFPSFQRHAAYCRRSSLQSAE